jgi:mannose-6-phosphate isomerase-like protein (cupin superfamily)
MSHWRPGIQLACLGSVAALGLLNVPQVLAQQAPPAHAPPPSWYAWAPKSTAEHPWKAPQKPIWRLSEIVAAHQGHASWTEQIVLDHDYDAKYIQMAPGEKTRTLFWADDRIFFVVWGGQIRFTIQGQQPFVAAKGFLVQVPYRTPYSMETVGSASRWCAAAARRSIRPTARQHPLPPRPARNTLRPAMSRRPTRTRT